MAKKKLNIKKLIRSKTLWLNFAAGFIPLVGLQLEMFRDFMTPLHFVVYSSVIAMLNFFVRFVTSQPLFIEASDDMGLKKLEDAGSVGPVGGSFSSGEDMGEQPQGRDPVEGA